MPYRNTVHRRRQWVRTGRISGQAVDPQLKVDLAEHRCAIERDLPASERLVDRME